MPYAVSIHGAPALEGITDWAVYDGSNNQTYGAFAKSVQPAQELTVASVSKAAAAVIAVTGHGLASGNPVTISGGTGSWAGLNGTHVITVINANSFSVAVDSSGYSGSFAGKLTTTAPRSCDAVWAVCKMTYTGSNRTLTQWADGNGMMDNVRDNYATLIFQ